MQLGHMTVGDGQPLFVIAGPCVIETESLIMSTAETLKQVGDDLGVGVISKAPLIRQTDRLSTAIADPGLKKA